LNSDFGRVALAAFEVTLQYVLGRSEENYDIS
jgi:hypothetical protein